MIDPHPERQQSLRVVPGHKLYRKVHITKVGVVSSSLTNKIKVRDFNNKLGVGEEAIFAKFPGATAWQIRVYSTYMTMVEKPDTLVIVAGGNDLALQMREEDRRGGNVNIEGIANDILDIARGAKVQGIHDIHVSSVLVRRGLKNEGFRRDINVYIKQRCEAEGFKYLCHDNIMLSDLWVDGIHLNSGGTQKLRENLLRCCTSYNPYLCD